MISKFLIRSKNTNFLQPLDARAKFIFTTALIVLALSHSISSAVAYSIVFIFELAAFYFSGKGFILYLKHTARIYPMFLLFTIPMPFRSLAAGKDMLWQWYFLKMYSSGLGQFIDIQLQLLLIYWAVLIFVHNTPASEFIAALERMRLPAWFIAVIRLMQHFFMLIQNEFRRLHLAFRSRYSGKKKRLLLKAAVNISALYMMRLIVRSEKSYLAMISRGFNGTFPNQKPLQWGIKDTLIAIVSLALILGTKL